MAPQTRIRTMRRPGAQRNREAAEPRQTYYDPAIRAARRAIRRRGRGRLAGG